MELLSGSVSVPASARIAYVSQQAWIRNASLRENILFGAPYQRERYEAVLEMCALRPDIAILPGGDETEIGESLKGADILSQMSNLIVFSSSFEKLIRRKGNQSKWR